MEISLGFFPFRLCYTNTCSFPFFQLVFSSVGNRTFVLGFYGILMEAQVVSARDQ